GHELDALDRPEQLIDPREHPRPADRVERLRAQLGLLRLAEIGGRVIGGELEREQRGGGTARRPRWGRRASRAPRLRRAARRLRRPVRAKCWSGSRPGSPAAPSRAIARRDRSSLRTARGWRAEPTPAAVI